MRKLIFAQDCPKVNGYLRSCIYDLTREEYYLSKKFYKINSISAEYLQFLIENEVVFYVNDKILNYFKKLKFDYSTYSLITNITFEIDSFDIKNFHKLKGLNCLTFGLLIYHFDFNRLKSLLSEIINETIETLSLYIFDSNIAIENLHSLNNLYLQFSFVEIVVFTDNHSIFNSVETSDKENYILFKSSKEFNSQEIDDRVFVCNVEAFSEAQNFNLYFNRKLYISSNGDIKNSINSKNTYCNISVLDDHELTYPFLCEKENALWFVNKGKIEVCKDCEFRYMCVDPRVPIKRNNDDWYFETECNYNPYIAKWKGEDGYRTLAECGITCNEKEFKINYKKLKKINEELWDE